MAGVAFAKVVKYSCNLHALPIYGQSKRFYSVFKNVVPMLYPTLRERLEERDITRKDPELYASVNIGLPSDNSQKVLRNERISKHRQSKKNMQLGIQSRNSSFKLDLNEVDVDHRSSSGQIQISNWAKHCGIFNDLFGQAFFIPRVPMTILFEFDEDTVSPVYYGNCIKPKEATKVPTVEFESSPDDLWTLILTNPDGNLKEENAECIHWFIGNIPCNDISGGEVIVDYLQPFPPRGLGYQRLVFILYKQSRKLDYSTLKKKLPCLSLNERTFHTLDFYRERQDDLTPASLGWFQCDWDSSLTDFFHHVLEMREPTYEYEFPEPYVAPQKYFPLKRAFNTYMDLHRDKKDIAQEVLMKRLKTIHPFQPEKHLHFPNAQPFDYSFKSWQKMDMRRQRQGLLKYKDLRRDIKPQGL